MLDLLSPVLEALYAAVVWLFDIVVAIGMAILAQVLDWFPNITPYITSAITTWTSMLYYAEVANGWIPVDVGFVLLGLYFAFLLVFVTVKMILKLIPFIG